MLIGIYTNLHKDVGCEVTRRIVGCLTKSGIAFCVIKDAADILNIPGVSKRELLQSSTIILTVGGDGTILGVIAEAARRGTEILGVNLGNLGFLSEIEVSELEESLKLIAAGKYFTESRTMLTVTASGKTFYSLNEAVLSRTDDSRMIDIGVYADSYFMDNYRADGFIVSTPTGSTAYSLSAGGPILSPAVNGFVLTPICSHSLHNKPIVVDDSVRVIIRAGKSNYKNSLAIDGIVVIIGDKIDEIIIKKSHLVAKFIRLKPHNFYKRLLNKINIWSYAKEADDKED